MAPRWRRLITAFWLGTALPVAAFAQERFDLPTRPGVTQPVYLSAAPAPVASALLYPGGSGAVAAVDPMKPATSRI